MSSSNAEGCLLCRGERLTEWHFEDETCWIADCMVCATPMIVWRTHGLPDSETERLLVERLDLIATSRYGLGGYWIDGERRRIPDHWHAHARPAGGFFGIDSPLYHQHDPRSR